MIGQKSIMRGMFLNSRILEHEVTQTKGCVDSLSDSSVSELKNATTRELLKGYLTSGEQKS